MTLEVSLVDQDEEISLLGGFRSCLRDAVEAEKQ